MAAYRVIGLTVSTSVFMQFLDATALNTALPAMGRDLGVPAVSLNVAILAYQLALAALIPIGNIAADRIGGRNAFAASLLVFLIGSLLCAASRSLPALVAARAFQGLGGAVMMPVSRQLVIRSAARHELVSAMNWLLIPGIIGPIVGPVFGGLIVTYANWHWIFLINVPVALIGIAFSLALVPNRVVHGYRPADIKGIVLIAVGIVCLVFGLEGLSHPSGGGRSAALVGAGLVLGLLYVRHAAGNPDAALDLSLLRIGSFRHSMISGTMLRVIVGSAGFLIPLWLQLAMGMSASQSGLLSAANMCGTLLSRALIAPLMRLMHPRRVAIIAASALAVFLAAGATVSSGLSQPVYAAGLLALGILISVPLVIISAAAYVDVPTERIGAATGLYTIVQQLTLSLGVTAGVLTIGAMHRLTGSGHEDNITYQGSFLMLAVLAAAAVYATSRLGNESLGALRPQDIVQPEESG